MKRTYALLFLVIVCFGLFVSAKKDETQNGPLLDRLLRYRRQSSGGVNYGFPTFLDFPKQPQILNFGQPNIGQGGGGGAGIGGGLDSRIGIYDFMPDLSQVQGNQAWTTKSCVYDEKGKEKCVEQHGNKPKH